MDRTDGGQGAGGVLMIQEMIYGPNTAAVQSIIDRIPTLTDDEIKRLGAAWDAAWDASRSAARDAVAGASWYAAMHASRYAAMHAAWDAAWGAAWDASRSAAMSTVLATVTYDLATETGPYTIAQRDMLLAPWIEVCG